MATEPTPPVAQTEDGAMPVPTASPIPLAPVAESDRIATIDVLRGVAVLGILVVNILLFAFPFAESQNWNREDVSTLDAACLDFTEFFFSFKFITLFSLLFGMGLALQSKRAAARQRPFAGTYAWRLVLLLFIGLAHATLLWYGDILTCYALLGFVALLLHKLRPKVLVILATICLMIPVAFMGGCTILLPDKMSQMEVDWQQMADEYRASSESISPDDPTLKFFEFMGAEEEIYQSGTWGEMVAHRTVTYALLVGPATIVVYGWRALAMFLLGICFVRWGLFIEPGRHRTTYRRMLWIGLSAGVTLQLLVVLARMLDPGNPWAMMAYFSGLYLGSLGLALAYAAGIALICMRPEWLLRLGRFAAVGRMALTNYLCQSIICGLIFYNYGLGLFGTVSHLTALLVVFAIFAAQLVLSPIWLRNFHYGPFEWAWRSLTYRQAQPMRRRRVGINAGSLDRPS